MRVYLEQSCPSQSSTERNESQESDEGRSLYVRRTFSGGGSPGEEPVT